MPEQVAIVGSELVKVTAFPDAPPVADTVKGASPYVLAVSALNVITWGCLGINVNPALEAVESCVNTSTSPEVPLPTTAVIVLASTIVNDVALVPPNETPVAQSKFVPVIVTVWPIYAESGSNEVICACGLTWAASFDDSIEFTKAPDLPKDIAKSMKLYINPFLT